MYQSWYKISYIFPSFTTTTIETTTILLQQLLQLLGTLKPFGRLVVVQFGSLVVVQFLRFGVYLVPCVTRTCEMRTGFAVNS